VLPLSFDEGVVFDSSDGGDCAHIRCEAGKASKIHAKSR
jgi:hypothetical protein